MARLAKRWRHVGHRKAKEKREKKKESKKQAEDGRLHNIVSEEADREPSCAEKDLNL